jgi:hypothetical protein
MILAGSFDYPSIIRNLEQTFNRNISLVLYTVLMNMEENKKLAREAALIWSTRDFLKLHELYAKGCMHYQQHEQKTVVLSGIDAWRKFMEDFLHIHPDYQEEIIDQIAEQDKVVSVLDCRTSILHWSGIVIDRIEQGKIKETKAWFKRGPTI